MRDSDRLLNQQNETFNYNEYRENKIKEALNDKIKDSIFVKRNEVRINDSLAVRLKGDSKKAEKILSDPRFGKLFTNKDFEINEQEDTRRRPNTQKGKSQI